MSYRVQVSEGDIDDVLNKAAEGVETGSFVPGESYESGVQAGILWVLGQTDENPMDL